MKKLNKKGFTLVELLAVIVILAIVLIIAVPGVLTIIDNSRKDALISSAKTLKDAARLFVTTSDDITAVPDGSIVWIPVSCLETDVSENGFGKDIDPAKSFMAVTKSGNQFSYNAYLYSGSGEMTVDPTKDIDSLARGDVRAWASGDLTFTDAPTGANAGKVIKLDSCKVPASSPTT